MSNAAHIVTDGIIDKIDELSPLGCAGALRLRFSRPLYYFARYPEDWKTYYGENNLSLCDPTIIWGLTHVGMKRWSEVPIPDPFGVLKKGRDFRLNYGVIMSYGPQNARSLLGCAREDREFTDEEINTFHDLLVSAHDSLKDIATLSDQQIEALRLFSQGCDYDEMSARLGISRTTLKYRLNGARKRLGANSNVDAVRIASERALLNPHSYMGTTGEM